MLVVYRSQRDLTVSVPKAMLVDGPRQEPSAVERALMKRDGYLVARGFFDAMQVDNIARWTAELAMAPETSGRHWVHHEPSVTQPQRAVIQRIEATVVPAAIDSSFPTAARSD
jgi:hypothetical protein